MKKQSFFFVHKCLPLEWQSALQSVLHLYILWIALRSWFITPFVWFLIKTTKDRIVFNWLRWERSRRGVASLPGFSTGTARGGRTPNSSPHLASRPRRQTAGSGWSVNVAAQSWFHLPEIKTHNIYYYFKIYNIHTAWALYFDIIYSPQFSYSRTLFVSK